MRLEVKGQLIDLSEYSVIAVNMDLKTVVCDNENDAEKLQNKLRESERVNNTVYTDTEIYKEIYK